MKTVIKNVRLSYANVFEPKVDISGKAKYSCSFIISKNDTETIESLKAAIKACVTENADKLKRNGKLIPNLKLLLRDGDIDRPDDEAYKNSVFFNASSNEGHRPTIINRRKQLITDPEEVYSGCYANVMVNLFAYNTNGNAGISAGLMAVQKVADGEHLGGSAVTLDDFDDLGDDSNGGGADDFSGLGL